MIPLSRLLETPRQFTTVSRNASPKRPTTAITSVHTADNAATHLTASVPRDIPTRLELSLLGQLSFNGPVPNGGWISACNLARNKRYFYYNCVIMLYLVNFICALIKRESKVVEDKVKNSENSADIKRLAHLQINFFEELTEKVGLD